MHLLLTNTSGIKSVPTGVKENVYFILDNSRNFEDRAKRKASNFGDDCGVWNSTSGSSPKFHYILHIDGTLSTVFLRQNQYCDRKMIQIFFKYIPMDPQPDNSKVIVVHRYYTAPKLDKEYKKRVTWLGDGGLQSSLSVVDYFGKFPGLAPRGNGSSKSSEYVRTDRDVILKIDELTDKIKPHQIYHYLKSHFDEVTGPSGRNVRVILMRSLVSQVESKYVTCNTTRELKTTRLKVTRIILLTR